MKSKHTRELLLPNECMDLVKMFAKKGGYNHMCLTAMRFQTSAAEAISIATLSLSLSQPAAHSYFGSVQTSAAEAIAIMLKYFFSPCRSKLGVNHLINQTNN